MPRKSTRKAAARKTVAKAKTPKKKTASKKEDALVKQPAEFTEPEDLDPEFDSEDSDVTDEGLARCPSTFVTAQAVEVRCRLAEGHEGQHDSPTVNGVSYSWD